MTITGMDAWLTLALDEKDANKAVVLAGSIRRTFTTKKLAVLTTFGLSACARERLQKVFDLVAFVEQNSPNGCCLEDHAKKEAFSLQVFSKCVFLSPNMMVIKNCDEIFTKYENFAMGVNGDEPDSSIYVFTPSPAYKEALSMIMHSMSPVENGRGEKGEMFGKCFRLWMDNQLPVWNNLGNEYNVHLDLRGGNPKSLSTKMFISNLGACHPLDLEANGEMANLSELGTLEKFAVELCRKIAMEDLRYNANLLPLPLASEEFKSEPIAIVGMSFRLPGGNNATEFWDLLINGKDAITVPPESRWLPEHIYRPCQTRNVTAGFLSTPLDEFDYKFFGLSGKEAEFIDPQYRLLHEVAWEALEDAMINPHSLRGTQTGIFVGSWLQDYKEIVNRIVDEDFFRAYMGTSIGAGAARLSHFFETVGPNISTESGCSSAIVAVDMACKSLRTRDSNMALACGVNLLLTPFDNNTLKLLTSPEGRCKTFDEGADGFGRAEGCAVLLMKRLPDAVRDGDNIWGLIRGSAVTQEGTSNSLGTPTILCESLAMELALKDAHVNPVDVSYIEAHGTGTVVGDPLEIAAITKAYYSSGRLEPLVIGSVKTNVGHTESVSGITGIIKVLLSMRNGMIPPHINLKKLNPAINLDRIPAKIPLEAMTWRKLNGKPRIAGVSSFGISGSDGHVIIQEAPLTSQPQIVCNDMKPRPLHIMKLSAKSPESLQEQISTYENLFTLMDEKSSSDAGFADFAYSANTGRATFNHRAVILAKDFKKAAQLLKTKSFKSAEMKSSGSPLCFLFTGQGTQYPDMGAELYATSPIFRDEFHKCEQILLKLYGLHLREILWGDYTDDQSRARYAQIGIFCIEYCLLRLWESWGVRPDYVLGHSLGEFAAAVAAGILSLRDSLIMIVEGRSRSMECLQYGKMIVIPAGKEKVDLIIQKFKQLNPPFWADYAALNSPVQTVLAGEPKMIDEFAQFCGANSIPTTVLGLTHAYHSRLMEPMREPYGKVAASVKTLRPGEGSPKYISALKGRLVEPEEIDAEYWLHHLGQTVNFMDACKTAKNEGCTVFLDIGPHPVLSALTMANFEGEPVTCLPSIRKRQGDWATMLDSLAKLYLSDWNGQVDWNGFDRFYKRSRVPLPFYPFNRKPVWKRLEVTLPTIHPLLGKVTPTGCGHTIFENRITLKNAPFVRDHVIGNTVVFPAAAFMEMCLAGGHTTAHGAGVNGGLMKPRRPVALQSLRIVSPLGLHDDKFYRLQTTSKLEMDDNGLIQYSVGINRNVSLDSGGAGGWISQATAKFLPVPPTSRKDPIIIDIHSIRSSWEGVDVSEFYDRYPEVGLRFGPTFRSFTMGWKSEAGALLSVKLPEEKDDRYLIHPVIADAMIQAIMLWTNKDKLGKMKLNVPIEIGKFLLLGRPNSENIYVYCWTNESGNSISILTDDEGTHLARMSGVSFIETSVKLMEGMMLNQGATLTKIWREVWKPSPGPCQCAYDLTVGPEGLPFLQISSEQTRKQNDTGDYERSFRKNLSNLSRLFFLKAMYELGWNPQKGTSFHLEELTSLLPHPKEHVKKYIRFFLQSMMEAEMLIPDPDDKDKFYFGCHPPIPEEIGKGLKVVISSEDMSRVEYKLVLKTGLGLSQVWLGKVDPSTSSSLDSFNEVKTSWLMNPIRQVNELLFKNVIDEIGASQSQSQSQPILRVLEVGAGTGAISNLFLDQLEKWGKPYEFYCTDVSTSYFPDGKIQLAKYLKNLIFKKFDQEEDFLSQGFYPNYFDIILASDVLHLAKDIRKAVGNITELLKPGGIIQIIEMTRPDPGLTQIIGQGEGYWQFQDVDLRPHHPTMASQKWEDVLNSLNFDLVVSTPGENDCYSVITARLSNRGSNNVNLEVAHPPQWLIFYQPSNEELAEQLKCKLEGVGRWAQTVKRPSNCTEDQIKELMKSVIHPSSCGGNVICEGIIYLWGLPGDIDVINRDQSEVSLPLLSLVQEVLSSKCKLPPRLYVITQGAGNVEGHNVTDPAAATLQGMMKSFSNELFELQLTNIDLSPDDFLLDQVDDLFLELWNGDKDNLTIIFRDGERLVPKMINARIGNNEPLPLPSGCDRFQLVLPPTRMISNLEFGVLDASPLEGNEVEVEVKSVALNFRDVFAVLKPIPQFEEINSVGVDYAGVVSKVGGKVNHLRIGDRVIGMNLEKNLSLPSHIKTEEQYVIPLPPFLTFSEGVTLPAVFFTSYLCLVTIAKMKRGDTVLIHTASGGVGLCAIQLAKLMGAEVIVTAGSKRKQNYLRQLGITHVFHSRTTDFGPQILEVTNGRGVDIVLNSITGEGFKEASLSALAKNGRFIEMSKLNVWTQEEVKELRPDVFYQIVDLTTLNKSDLLGLIDQLKELLVANHIQPIPYEQFEAVNIRGALSYLQKAKHIGKIVCLMPEVKVEHSKIIASTPLFNELSTYLVTGGLGGIGLEVVKWMLSSGARHIAIVSRSPPKPDTVSLIDSWNKSGKHVVSFAVDIGDYDQCRQLFLELKSPDRGFPQIRGVMHAAGVLVDATLENQNWTKFQQTYNPKVNGTWNLHHLTKDLLLEHFVLFSSIAASFGSPGQSNHAASNSFEDSLAAYRRSIGLPATSINWGNWGEVGVASEVDFPGMRPISTSQGILTLETILKAQESHLCACNIDSFALAGKIFPSLKTFVEDKQLFGDLKGDFIINTDEFWKEVDQNQDREGKLVVFKNLIKITLRTILKMTKDEAIDDLTEFQTLGVDSLMMLEMKNGLQNILGTRLILSANEVKDCTNTQSLADRLIDNLGGEEYLSKIVLPTLEELQELIQEDSILPEHIQIKPGKETSLCKISEAETILLTGVTGSLGPYILAELCRRPHIKKIICLIRKTGKVSLSERLTKRLKEVNLEDQVDMAKVSCIQGDITEDKLGLSESEYNRLAEQTDAVINSAVRADHTAKYFKAPEGSKQDIRSVNAKSTVQILEFAVHSKLKHVFQASSLLCVFTTDDEVDNGDDDCYDLENDKGYFSEKWQDQDILDHLPYNLGYPLSKHISEELCRQAVQRGIPCKTFRLPIIGGDSRNGRCDYRSNHVTLRWLTFLKLKCVPDTLTPIIVIPVDHCARLSLDVFFHSRALPDVYNVIHPEGGSEGEIVVKFAAELGIPINTISMHDFIDKVKQVGDDSPLAPFMKLYRDDEEEFFQLLDENSVIKCLRKVAEDNKNFFRSRKLEQLLGNYWGEYESTEVVMRRDITYLKGVGLFDKFGIK